MEVEVWLVISGSLQDGGFHALLALSLGIFLIQEPRITQLTPME